MSEIAAARQGDSGARFGVLVVDDEEAILESIELTLGSEYRVLTATTGDAGLEILDKEDIACVIVDQNMPGMSGVEFLVRVIERQPRTVRMLLTGYSDIKVVIQALNDELLWKYVAKPWDHEDLKGLVLKAARQCVKEDGVQAEEYGFSPSFLGL